MIKVNAIGEVCPKPVIMTKKALKEIKNGVVEVSVDNETAKENIQSWVKRMEGVRGGDGRLTFK